VSYRKKLIEVALPLAEINDASAYDKMPGIGPHPKGIHHWWARLPLPCARAILFASLVDDPSSDPAFAGKPEKVQDAERERLFKLIRALLQKKIHEKPGVFEQAHKEIVRACGGELPKVLDPFCGGGTIPLEAQRLGLEVYAGDLNPVAVLITKTLVEIVPRFAERPPVNPVARKELAHSSGWPGAKGLAEDVRHYGKWIKEEAIKRIGYLYPKIKLPKEYGGSEANVIAWLWARTVKCPNPGCAGQTPLVRSFSLAAKKGGRAWIEPALDKKKKIICYEVKNGTGSGPAGTIGKKGAHCLFCKEPFSFNYIRAEGKQGRIGTQLLAIIAEGHRGRVYLPSQEDHAEIAAEVRPKSFIDTDIPEKALGFRVQAYGMIKHRHLFTSRQLQALGVFSDLVKEIHETILDDARRAGGWAKEQDQPLHQGGSGPTAYAEAVTLFLGFGLDRCADFNNSLCTWSPTNEKVMHLFGRGAIPMTWDHAEANILGESVGSWSTCSDYVAECIEVISAGLKPKSQVQQLDAASAAPDGEGFLVSTDPPYYANIGYSDLSDFFYVWLRQTVGNIYPDIFSTVLVPKAPELVAAPERFENDKEKAKEHFEKGFKKAFTLLRQKLDPRFPITVYYAFKQEDEGGQDDADRESGNNVDLTTGWETLLEALISTGFQITATWPIRASQAWRMRAMGSNALASYIVLACRPRPDDAALSTRREFQGALKRELPGALKKLQHGNVAPVDLAQASIGPGMSVFSRFSKVIEADGKPMTVRTALGLINKMLDEVLTEQEGEFDANTRWALAWFDQYAHNEGPYGVAETLSKAKDATVGSLVEAGILYAKGGKVRLLKREDLASGWDPAQDTRITIWEVTQHLIRSLQKGGEQATAILLRKLGDIAEIARDLAYRLYLTCERKGWTQDALAYNSLVIAWPEISRLAATSEGVQQPELFT